MGISQEGVPSNELRSEILQVKYDVPFKISPNLDDLRMVEGKGIQYAQLELPFNLNGIGGAFVLHTLDRAYINLQDPNRYHYPSGKVKLPPIYMSSSGVSISDKAGYRAFPLEMHLVLKTNYKNVTAVMDAGSERYYAYNPYGNTDIGNVQYSLWDHDQYDRKPVLFNQSPDDFNSLSFMFTMKLPEDIHPDLV